MAYINPYEEELLRRRQQQQVDVPRFQQPAPMANLPLYSGPEQAQWTPMGDGGQQNFQDAGAGMASLIKRFRKPGEPSSHSSAIGHGGAGGGIGPPAHGY